MPYTARRTLAAVAVLALTLTACGNDAPSQAAAPPPPQVGVVKVEASPVPVVQQLPGRLEASRVAEVRARAAGIVQQRVFEEGSEVEAGEVLFRIDPAPLKAALASAEAQLMRAQANLKQARITVDRYQPLVKSNAISRQDYDNALAARDQAAAEVAAAKAAVDSAELNLGYATVTAPISGRIGRAMVTEGALVGQGEPTPLATIQQIDPIYVNLTQSSAELLRLRRALASGEIDAGAGAKVTVFTEDGEPHPQGGRLLFSDVSVDESTGAVTLRVEVPNPDRLLLPGMYVRARLEQGVANNALTVPQQAVSHSAQGSTVLVVDEDGTAQVRPVELGRLHGDSWVVSAGLAAGERVIVDGLQKVAPGAPVAAVPWRNPLLSTSEVVQAGEPGQTQPN